MLRKPSLEIENEVLAEYDRDYVGFCKQVFEDLERTNPGLADVFYMIKDYEKQLPGVTLGLQRASAVYRQLERAAMGSLPIVEMRSALEAVAFEALEDPEAFVNKYGTPYFYNGLIGQWTLAACVTDSIGNSVDWEVVVFVVVLMIRILEAQVELDLATPPGSTH